MKFLLGSNPRVGRVLTAFDAAEALRLLRSDDPELIGRRDEDESIVDAVFADVSMPGLSGMELARVLTAFRNPPALVFITGHEENALEAFEVGALDYIMKPANADRVDRALRGIEKNKQQAVPAGNGPKPLEAPAPDDDEVIPVELAGTTRMIPRKEVRWVEAQGDYARLHTTEGSHLVRIPLAQLEERWGEAGFLRIHRSFLVSLALVTELRMSSSGYSVVLGGGPPKELPVSRRHTRELKDRLVKAPRDNWGQQ
ncbi:two component transcriptional regulator, LytTR family [Saccharopolyspora flava]|uniref:Two component transcriptional regulator, LytTR family n=2 Tax=Saccharopolyspora flava TaxID=95161 RepID=A0A1I6T509_9PSEU|nr:two component transcriptional regulator, LytTR family [Saccharopolyspora flava]